MKRSARRKLAREIPKSGFRQAPSDFETGYLVTAKADEPLIIKGSSFDRICARCAKSVMIAPSGQEFLVRHPRISVICTDCFDPEGKDKGAEFFATTSRDCIIRELGTVIPNPRGARN